MVTSSQQWARVQPRVLADVSRVPVLGLDLEWVGARPAALLQLATISGTAVILRLPQLGTLPLSLKEGRALYLELATNLFVESCYYCFHI